MQTGVLQAKDNWCNEYPTLNERNNRFLGSIYKSSMRCQAPRDQLQLTVVRAFQDGPYAVTQATGQRSGRNVFFDIFRFEDGLVVEHWAYSAMDAPPNQSGHTQTDGPMEAKRSEDTEKNKSIVREYYETIHVSGDHSKIPHYFAGDHCIRHEQGVLDGVTAFKRDLEELTKHRSINEIKFVLGQGASFS